MAKLKELHIIKKDGTLEDFDIQKVIKAITLSAERVMVRLSDEELKKFCAGVEKKTLEIAKERDTDKIEVADMHRIVESNLDTINKSVAQSYRDYRNYKIGFVHMMDNVFKDAQKIMYLGDVDNANTDSALVSTRRSLIYNSLNKELYKKFFLRVDELQAVRDGYIYIHDISARRDTLNCCLCDISSILDGGFEMANQWYNEPKSLDTAFDVIGDVVLSAASQQYGGFTVPQIDQVLYKYAKMSYDRYIDEAMSLYDDVLDGNKDSKTVKKLEKKAKEYANKKIRRDFEQGFQGWEYKFNTVASSRGDYPLL
jgi:ribonucleoside-triphosphate reductase